MADNCIYGRQFSEGWGRGSCSSPQPEGEWGEGGEDQVNKLSTTFSETFYLKVNRKTFLLVI